MKIGDRRVSQQKSEEFKCFLEMNNIEKQLFCLLRLALWEAKDESTLPILTASEWNDVFELAKEQCVAEIILDGINRLEPEARPPQALVMKWLGRMMMMERRNLQLNLVVEKLFGKLHRMNLTPVLMKGQALAQNYPNPLHRTCGDIDVYFKHRPDCDKAVEWTRSIAGKGVEGNDSPWERKHFAFFVNGTEIELHYQMCRFENKQLQRRLQEIIDDEFQRCSAYHVMIGAVEIETVPPTLAVLHQLMHITRHLLEAGVGLRQICDLALYMNRHLEEIEVGRVKEYLHDLQLEKVAEALGSLMVGCMGLDEAKWPFGINNHHLDFLIREIFDGGNFGHRRTAYQAQTHGVRRKWNSMRYFWQRCLLYRHLLPKEARGYFLSKLTTNLFSR